MAEIDPAEYLASQGWLTCERCREFKPDEPLFYLHPPQMMAEHLALHEALRSTDKPRRLNREESDRLFA